MKKRTILSIVSTEKLSVQQLKAIKGGGDGDPPKIRLGHVVSSPPG